MEHSNSLVVPCVFTPGANQFAPAHRGKRRQNRKSASPVRRLVPLRRTLRLAIVRRGIPRARRPPVAHECGLPFPRVSRSLRRPQRCQPRKHCLLPIIRQHFRNRHFQRWISPAGLLIGVPRTRERVSTNPVSAPRSDSTCWPSPSCESNSCSHRESF